MMPFLEALGLNRPAPPLELLCATGFFLLLAGKRKAPKGLAERLLPAAYAIAALAYLWCVLRYLTAPSFVDHVEPHIAGVGYIALKGEPLYHALDYEGRYTVYYGPLLYLITGAFEHLFGGALFSAKLPGALAALAAPIVMFVALSRRLGKKTALPATALFVTFLLIFGRAVSWPRAEPYVMLFATLALLGGTARSRLSALALCTLSVAGLTGLKFHAAIYAIPGLALLVSSFGWPAAIGAGVVGFALGFTPFLAPNISLNHYLTWLRLTSVHRFDATVFSWNLQWTVFALLPALLALASVRRPAQFVRDHWPLVGGFAFSTALTIWIAGKPGAEKHHVLPLLPGVCLLYATVLARSAREIARRDLWARGSLALAIVFGLAAGTGQLDFMQRLESARELEPAIEEILGVIRDNPGKTVAIAPSGDHRLIYYRHIPVLAGSPFFLDENALMDMHLYGLPIPPATYRALDTCKIDLWLSGANSDVFNMQSYYNGDRIVDPQFRDAFLARYEWVGTLKYYDLWRCRPKGTGSTTPPSP